MGVQNEIRVAPDVMIRLVRSMFERAGCSVTEAACIAERLTGANLRGHDSHGVIRVPRYLEWIESGRQKIGQTVEIVMENDVMAILDGNYGFGQSIGEQAVDLGLKKVKQHGLALTALRNSGHLGRIGDWAERAAAAGVASLHMVNVRGSLLVAPFGARERRMGTSPFCTGVPVAGQEPVIHDFATSTVAEGKALVALRGGKPLPEGSMIDADGSLTSDPRPLYGDVTEGKAPMPYDGPGALTAFGAHKGSGLNFMMEMMAGALTGSGCAGGPDEPERRKFCNGMLSIYIDTEKFNGRDSMAEEIKSYIAFVKSARTADGHDDVLVPGENERRVMAERQAEGLPLSEAAWSDILDAAHRLGFADAELNALKVL
ncbi:malate/lactate/ureidoglycolate dehydrogenase [Nisaea sp.]|uniref:malate/lactate/ureidoglycolate dehydrogenase n=1 Tax=Nisaea sp. TaxID=2024842 RepID=UPI003298FA9E